MSDRISITDADLNRAIRAGNAWAAELPEGDAASVVSAAVAVAVPAPVPVVWAEAPPPDDAAVVSVGEPGILAGPGGSGRASSPSMSRWQPYQPGPEASRAVFVAWERVRRPVACPRQATNSATL